MDSSPLFLLVGSKDILGTDILCPLIQPAALFCATHPIVSG